MLLLAIPGFGSEPEHPLLPADTSSPRATLASFIENCETAYGILRESGRSTDDEEALAAAEDAVRNIMRCMNLSQVPEFRRENTGKEAAVALKEVLDRIALPKESSIPDRKGMTDEDDSLTAGWTIPLMRTP